MDARFSALGLFVLPILLGGCGGSSENVTPTYFVNVRFARQAVSQTCAETPEVQLIRINGLQNGLAAAGFPIEVPCDGAGVVLRVQPGAYELTIEGIGPLGEDPAATLYRTQTDVSFPENDNLEVALESQVAYLNLSWVFGAEELAPCGIDVADVRLFVSARGSQSAAFSGNFPCTAGPIAIDTPFDLTDFDIRLEARASDGLILYRSERNRLLTPGENNITVPLEPLGGRLLVNFEFAVAADSFSACDGAAVGVSMVDAEVTVLGGGGNTVRRQIDCTAPRPVAIPGLRFTQGRELLMTLTADGQEFFSGDTTFMMPAGDYREGFLRLDAVGSSTVSIQVQTSSCASTEVTKVRTTLQRSEPTGGGEPVTSEIATPAMSGAFDGLPYGRYRVELVQETLRGTDLCRRVEDRTIDARINDWEPFVF